MSAQLSGVPVLVAGLGVSGAAAAGALARLGADVLAVDSGDAPAVARRAAELRDQGVDVRIGQGRLDPDLLAGRELVVPSPGLAESEPLLAAAAQRAVRVWSEPELAWRLAPDDTRLVAVTGTNGKTSTTELLAACLDAPAAGNIGAPLVELLARREPPPPELVVAELSSFQLRFCETLRPEVAVLLNIAPDHLDWHGSLAAYRAAKARLWRAQRPSDWTVTNADDTGAQRAVQEYPPRGRVVRFTRQPPPPGAVGVESGRLLSRLPGDAAGPILDVTALQARGEHHLANAAAAAAAALCAGASPGALAGPISAYRPGPHRLEETAVVAGVRWVNDSKATNPHAAAAALGSFSSIVWIAGGLAKGADFAGLAPLLRERVKAAVTIGAAGPEIARLTRDLELPTVEAADLEQAVRAADALAEPGDTVLLAPACASMDQFTDYAARGDAFRRAVHALTGRREEVAGGH